MRKDLTRVSSFRGAAAFGRPLLAGLVMLGLASCSATSMDEAAQAPADGSAAAIPPPATDETFPNLGSVPDEAPPVPSAAERQTVIEGLAADRANAQYTDQELTGNVVGASVAPPEPAPPPEVISTEPPPAAAPTAPVEAAPVTPSENVAPESALPAESEPVAEAPPAPDPSSAEAPATIPPTAEAAPEPPAPAAEPLTQASSTMTAPPPAAPAPEATPAPPPPDPAPAAQPAESIPEPAPEPMPEPAPVASVAAAPGSASPAPPPSAPAPSTSSLPLPGQPGTVIPPVSTHMPATLPPPLPAAAIAAEPIAPPPMPAPSATMPAATAAMPPATTVASVVPSGPFPYPQAISRPATYASGAVTVDMSALDGSGSSYYPAAMSNAYAPLPTAPAAYYAQPAYAQPAAYAPGPGAGGPAGLIYFGEGAAGLDASDREVLKSVGAIYRQRGGYIRLLGHASQDGGRATGFEAQQANLQLSWARANAVAQELARQGVDPGAIETGAVGDSQPLYVESTPAAEAANRRVEIYILY